MYINDSQQKYKYILLPSTSLKNFVIVTDVNTS